MESFLQYIANFGILSDSDQDLVKSRSKIRVLRKNDYFLEAGQVSKELGFITEGILRIFYFNKNGDQFTRFFLKEGHFAVNLYSFNDENESAEYLQCLTPVRMVVLTKTDMNYLYENIPGWTGIIKRLTEKALLEKMTLKNMLLESDATTRYLYLMDNYPEIMQQVALGHIASFLGITQSSLSRIRNSVSKNAFLPYDKF